MQYRVKKFMKTHAKSRMRRQKIVSVLVALSIVVSGSVFWSLKMTGVTLTGNAVCAMQEHVHSEECYGRVLVCNQAEGETHTHTDECYNIERALSCAEQEHVHGDGCYETREVLTCTQAESDEHHHSKENGCYETQRVLVCNVPEHVHGDACYTEQRVLVCGKSEGEAHVHTDACYEEQLICGIEEHTHTADCYADSTADVETASVWERTLPKKLTGNWVDDLIAVAESQLGYKESAVNFVLAADGETRRGYTRYGQWYGAPYSDWCAMFVSFCLNYSEIPKDAIPYKANCREWVAELEKLNLYNESSSELVPECGDIIFFDIKRNGTATHVGIVTEVDAEKGTVRTIEGNAGNAVRKKSYKLSDSSILGYGDLSAAKLRYDKIKGLALVETTCKAVIYTDSTYTTVAENCGDAITVSGLLPEGAEVKAYPAQVELEEQTVIASYDITVILPDGTVYEPSDEAALTVTITNPELTDDESYAVCYVPEDGDLEFVTTLAKNGEVSFEAEHFSVYAIVRAAGTRVTTAAALRTALQGTGTKQCYLDADITVQGGADFAISGNVTLDLNGHTLTLARGTTGGAAAPKFAVARSATLNIIDTVDSTDTPERGVGGDKYGRTAEFNERNKTLTYYVTETAVVNSATGATEETLVKHTVNFAGAIKASSSVVVDVANGGIFNLNGGMLYGGTNRAVNVNNGGTANLSGGYIANFNLAVGSGTQGGAVYVNGGTLNVSGNAVLAGNSAQNSGGAIFLTGGRANVSGGVISGNRVTITTAEGYGGGIYANNNATVTMSGGYITNNDILNKDGYNSGGGGIMVGGSRLNLEGGYITGNIASGGGGVMTQNGNSGTLNMTGGFVTGNIARACEGGGISIEWSGVGTITGGYVTNNRIIETQHWGGGGIFCSDNSTLYIYNILVTNNVAGGFGGGVSGCSTGRINIDINQGGAMYDNNAKGVNLSGGDSTKAEDHLCSRDKVFMENGFADYFCALSTTMRGTMLGDNPANWTGSADGVPLYNVPIDAVISADHRMGLVAHPSESAKQSAQEIAKVFVNGNDSYTHGGGILCNGYLLIGEIPKIELGARLQLDGVKNLIDEDGNKLDLEDGQFTFEIVDEAGAVVTSGTNDVDGNIIFERCIPFSEVGTFIFYMHEVKDPTKPNIQMDTSTYRITVDVTQQNLTPLPGSNPPVPRVQYLIKRIVIEKDMGDGVWGDEYVINNPENHENFPVDVKLPSPTFTNYAVTETNIRINKQWAGANVPHGPITVKIMRNGELFRTVELSNANNWSYYEEHLPLKDDKGNAYVYTVEEVSVPGYVSDYSVINKGDGGGYWVPVQNNEKLTVGQSYIVVNPAGDRALMLTPGHADAHLTVDDQVTITKHTEKLVVDKQTYTDWYPAGGSITANCMFTPMMSGEQQYAQNSKTKQMIFKNEGVGSWLLIQNGGTAGYLKGGSNEYYTSIIRLSGSSLTSPGHLQGALEFGNTNYYNIVYTGGKFNASTTNTNYVKLYKLISGSVSLDTTFIITNTPQADITYTVDLTKVSSANNQIPLAGAEFNLLDSNGKVLTFSGQNGNYAFAPSGQITNLVTSRFGKFVLTDLPAGEYTLREIKAPQGYKLAEDIKISFPSDNGTTLYLTVEDPMIEYVLPEAGGSGTLPYALCGSLLMLLPLLYGYRHRRKREGGLNP